MSVCPHETEFVHCGLIAVEAAQGHKVKNSKKTYWDRGLTFEFCALDYSVYGRRHKIHSCRRIYLT